MRLIIILHGPRRSISDYVLTLTRRKNNGVVSRSIDPLTVITPVRLFIANTKPGFESETI